MLDNLFKVINKTNPLNQSDQELCAEYFQLLECNRNTVLEEQGKTPKYLYFSNQGFLRLFYYDQEGDEVTTHFTSPNGFIASFLEFVHEKPASNYVECITDCQLLRIERPNLASLIAKSDSFKVFSLIIFEQAMAASQIRANDLATLTAEMRYKKLMEQQPQIIQHVPLQYIASFLGIKPESLSRIRRQMIT